MINTYNESSLHQSLKIIYARKEAGLKNWEKLNQNDSEIQLNGQKDVDFTSTDIDLNKLDIDLNKLIEQKIQLVSKSTGKKHEYICDIVTKDKKVIEIQTANLHSLTSKIMDFTAGKIHVKVVYPVTIKKYIQTFDESTGKITIRKSPAKKNIYNGFFKEATAFTPLLCNRYFSLEVLEIVCIEDRIKTEEPVQSKNGRRRFQKNWVKTGKRLKELGKSHVFNGKKSWLNLLPKGINKEFTVNEIYKKITESGIKTTRNECSLLVWILFHGKIIQRVGKEGNSYKYSIS